MSGEVTIVVAAYGRVDALNKTLRSVYRQTYTNWRLLVVADRCTPKFVEEVDRSDPRVEVINLPERSGHQYGPNSVGLSMADGEYVAFLNHDDIWLPDHLEKAISRLSSDGDFFLGRSAYCHAKNQAKWVERTGRLVFSELNRPRWIWRCLTGPASFFEPASSWVVQTETARGIGHWRAPDEVVGTPVEDWLRRASRLGATFCFEDDVTVLKINLHQLPPDKESRVPIYERDTGLLDRVDHYLGLDGDEVRRLVANDVALAPERDVLTRKPLWLPSALTRAERDRLLFFLLYVATGTIHPDVELSNGGRLAANVLRRRTGETLDAFTPPEALVALVRASMEQP